MRIIVADDDAMVRFALSAALTEIGHTVIEASGGDEAIRHLRTAAPDVTLLDLLMPDRSGFSVLRWLADHDPDAHRRVIVISSFQVDPEALAAYPHVEAVLQKPIVLRQLADRLEAIENVPLRAVA